MSWPTQAAAASYVLWIRSAALYAGSRGASNPQPRSAGRRRGVVLQLPWEGVGQAAMLPLSLALLQLRADAVPSDWRKASDRSLTTAPYATGHVASKDSLPEIRPQLSEKERAKVVFGGGKRGRKRRGHPQLRDTDDRQELASDATTCAKAMAVREGETRGETVLSERNGGGNCTQDRTLSRCGRGRGVRS